MFKKLLSIFAVVLFGIAATFAVGSGTQEHASGAASAQKNSAKPTAQSLAKAEEVYKIDCAVCHGANGNGKTDLAASMQLTLDDWTDPKTLAGKSDDELFKIIRDGKDKMPSEPAGRASDSEVRGLIQYIRSMAQQPATPATEK